MRKTLVIAVAAFESHLVGIGSGRLAGHSFGVGANYWKVLSDLDTEDVTNIDETGLSWLASYQYRPKGLFKLEIDLEYYPELAGEKTLWSPEAFVLVGGTFYAGAGVGIYYRTASSTTRPSSCCAPGSTSSSSRSSPSTSTRTTASTTGARSTPPTSIPTPSASARPFVSPSEGLPPALIIVTPGFREREASHEELAASFHRDGCFAQRRSDGLPAAGPGTRRVRRTRRCRTTPSSRTPRARGRAKQPGRGLTRERARHSHRSGVLRTARSPRESVCQVIKSW